MARGVSLDGLTCLGLDVAVFHGDGGGMIRVGYAIWDSDDQEHLHGAAAGAPSQGEGLGGADAPALRLRAAWRRGGRAVPRGRLAGAPRRAHGGRPDAGRRLARHGAVHRVDRARRPPLRPRRSRARLGHRTLRRRAQHGRVEVRSSPGRSSPAPCCRSPPASGATTTTRAARHARGGSERRPPDDRGFPRSPTARTASPSRAGASAPSSSPAHARSRCARSVAACAERRAASGRLAGNEVRDLIPGP